MAHLYSLSFRSLVLLGGLALTPAFGQPGSNDPTFNPGDVGNGNGDGFYPNDAYASLIQPDGKIILSGEFQTYNGSGPSYFVRLNPDGSRDGTFLMGSGPDYVNSIAATPTGDIIIGGVTMYDGVPIPNRVARIHADGTLDPTFQSAAGADRFVSVVAVQPDGKVLVAGGETVAPDTSVLWVGRLNPDGSLDNTFAIANAFDTADVNTIRGMALTSDSKVIVAGFFSAFNGVPQQGLLRLNADGTVDGGFTPDAALSGEIWCMALRSNDKVLLGGRSLLNDAGQNAMVQLNTDGSVDNTFDSGTGFALPSQPGVDPHLYSLLIDLDGKVAVGGRFDVLDGEPHEGLVRLNIDGSNDATFDTGLGCTGSIYTMSLDQDGSIVAAGNFQEYNGYGVGNIARIASDGGLDTGFNPGTGFYVQSNGIYAVGTAVTALAMQADSSFYAAGLFHGYNGVPRNRIARVLADGEVDPTFDPEKGFRNNDPGSFPPTTITSLLIQDDGKLIVAGRFDTYNGNSCGNIARLNPDGTFDPSFTTGSGFGSSGPDAPWVDYLAPGIGGKVVVSGPFMSYNGIACNGTVQLNADGTRDMGFAPVNYTRGPLAVQPDGKVIVDGGRLNMDGSTDLSWLFEGVSHNGSVGLLSCVTLQPDGRLLIGGWFTHVGAAPRDGIARLNPDGSLDTGFDPGTGIGSLLDGTRAIVLQDDGRVVIGGLFTEYNGIPRQGIARLESDGALDVSFEPGTGFGSLPELGSIGYVNALAIQPGNKLIAGGSFTSFDGIGRNRIARILITGDVCLPSQLTTTADPVISCGAVNLKFNGTSTIAATEVPGANKYQFRFTNTPGQPAYARTIAFPTRSFTLTPWYTKPLKAGRTYNVQVRASFDNGATWCDYGPSCTVKISWTPLAPFAEPRGFEAAYTEEPTELLLYPNPTNGDQVRIQLSGIDPELTIATMDIIDLFGKHVVSTTLPLQDGALNTSLALPGDLADGLYIVTIVTGEHLFTERFVVDR